MMIKANVRYNGYTNTMYTKNFFVENCLPEVGDEFADTVVTEVKEFTIDFQQGSYKVYNYNYYTVITENEDGDVFEDFIAIQKPEEEWVY